MALKLIVICALISIAVKGSKANLFDNDPFHFEMPKFNFPPIKMNFPKIQTPEELLQKYPNANYEGVVVSSASKSYVGPDGKVVKTGGTTVMSNDNGEKRVLKFGDNPPDLKTSSSGTKQDNIVEPVIIPEIKIPQIVVPQIKIPQITIPQMPTLESVMDSVNKNMQSISANKGFNGYQTVVSNFNPDGSGYQYASSTGGASGSSSSSSFSSSTVNGVTKGSGIASTYYNVNGDTGGKTVIFTTK